MMFCDLQQMSNGRWWCPECDPKQRRTVPSQSNRKCRKAPSHGLGDTIAKLIREYKCKGCKERGEHNGQKVRRHVFAERAEHCDKCEEREEVVCLAATADKCELAVLLGCPDHQCPEDKWPAFWHQFPNAPNNDGGI